VCTLRRYYDRVYFRFHHLKFEPSGSAVAPNPTSFKNAILGQNTCIEEILKSYKNSKKVLDVFVQKYTKCVAFLELNGIKTKLSSLIMGHFLNTSFCRSCDGSARNVQAVRNIDFSSFINLIRNPSTLRPLELMMYNPRFGGFLLQMNTNTCLIDRCLSCILLPRQSVVSSVRALFANWF